MFEPLGLSATTLAAVDEMGYTQPTPVQEQAIPAILDGRDVMAAAQTGTGKTAAFLLPVLDRLGHARRGRGPLMLVVTPTRELAQQIAQVAQAVCAHTHHRATTVVGGLGYEPQKQALKRGCDLLVATPGRLLDLLDQGACSLDGVEVLVLDEADRMLDMGFLPDMRKIVGKTPASRQTLLFSATLSNDVLAHTQSLVRDPVRVEIAPKGTAAKTVTQYVLGVSPEAKKRTLVEVLRREGSSRVIVFVRGKHRADHLCRILRKKGFSCAPIHGDRSQNQRMHALEQFDRGEVGVLLATDVLSRGIDIPEVTYVLNLDVPHDAEDYIHRIGRTGRAGERGWALTLCTEEEYWDLREIERLMGRVIDEYPRAEGMDLGERPLTLDPARSPRDRIPSKKARKREVAGRQQRAQTPRKAEKTTDERSRRRRNGRGTRRRG
ncbi:MAG: DEAD/DEAH box helicase [Coriobacteriales bacterium]|nr:DEAD/DEAH box helicase [Coriobacteriales bacterium]